MRPWKRVSLAALIVLASPIGCGSRSSGPHTTELPSDCSAFVTKYQSCLTATIPSAPAVAKERADQTRAALEQEAERATASASPASLTALAAKCHDNLQRLATSCVSPRTTH